MSYGPVFFPIEHGSSAVHKSRYVTYSTNREDEVSKILFLFYLYCVSGNDFYSRGTASNSNFWRISGDKSRTDLAAMARFILVTDHPSGKSDSSSDNSSAYKYGQTDGSSVQTKYLDNSCSSTNYVPGIIRLNGSSVCEITDSSYHIARPVFILDGWSVLMDDLSGRMICL